MCRDKTRFETWYHIVFIQNGAISERARQPESNILKAITKAPLFQASVELRLIRGATLGSPSNFPSLKLNWEEQHMNGLT